MVAPAKSRFFEYLEKSGALPKREERVEEDEFEHEADDATDLDLSLDSDSDLETESEGPMEYMALGGRVRELARERPVDRPSFVKALMRAR